MARTGSSRIMLTAGLVAVMAGAAFGQADAGAPDGKQRQREANPLRGPKVKTSVPPGGGGHLVENENDRYQTRPTPLRVYAAELRHMASETADDSIRLTEEQAKKIRSIVVAHAEEMREHIEDAGRNEMRRGEGMSAEDREMLMERRRRQIERERGGTGEALDREQERIRRRDAERSTDQQVRPQRDGQRRFAPDQGAPDEPARRGQRGASDRPSDRASDRPTDRPEMTPEQRRDRRAQFEEMREGAPDGQDAVRQIWSVLSKSQRDYLAEKVEARRQSIMDERLQMEAEDVDIDQARERFRQRLEQMPPEQRREALRRLRESRNESDAEVGPEREHRQQRERRGPPPTDAPSDG